jgi:CubicO group peptidase (beta-lactamase class C family)
MKHIIFIFSFVISQSIFAQVNTPKLDCLCTILNDSNKIIGSLCVFKNGNTLYEKAWGLQDNMDGRTLTNDNYSTIATRYRIGSISKMFTACIIFQLIEEKKLSLTTPLAVYYPEIKNANKITIADLLTHHSGIYNFTKDSAFASYIYTTKTHAEIIDIIKKYPSDFEPGSKAEYSNSNFVLLGYIIEKITSRTYAYELQNRIVKPLNLKNTYYGIASRMEQHEAWSFGYDENKWTAVQQSDMSIPHGAGAITSTPKELAMFITGLFQGKLISEASLKQMTTLRNKNGYGIFQYPLYDKKVWGHNGRIEEFTSMLIYNPADSTCFAFCNNGNNDFSTNDLALGVAGIFYNFPYTIPTFKTIPLDVKLLNSMVGKYASKTMPLKIELLNNNNQLFAQASGQSAFPMEYKGNGMFEFLAAGIVLEWDMKTQQSFTMKQGGGKYLYEREK